MARIGSLIERASERAGQGKGGGGKGDLSGKQIQMGVPASQGGKRRSLGECRGIDARKRVYAHPDSMKNEVLIKRDNKQLEGLMLWTLMRDAPPFDHVALSSSFTPTATEAGLCSCQLAP